MGIQREDTLFAPNPETASTGGRKKLCEGGGGDVDRAEEAKGGTPSGVNRF